jgi:hypothetical protein
MRKEERPPREVSACIVRAADAVSVLSSPPRPHRPEPAADLTVAGDGRVWEARRGGVRLDDVEFLNLAGRPDLARALEKRLQTKKVLVRVGLGGLGVGASIALTDIVLAQLGNAWVAGSVIDCEHPQLGRHCGWHSPMLYVGGGVAASGAIVALVGAALDGRPMSADEARRVARGDSLTLQPMLSATGGGLALGGRF